MAAKKGRIQDRRKLVDQVLDTSHQVWLAGLGTVAWTRNEGAKVFETLVKEGEKAQGETRKVLKESAAQAGKQVARTRAEAGKRLNRLERLVQSGVEGVLHRLGVPSAQDVRELSDRVNKLNKSMTALAAEK